MVPRDILKTNIEEYSVRKTNIIISVLMSGRLVSGAFGLFIVTKAAESPFPIDQVATNPLFWIALVSIVMAGVLNYSIRWIESNANVE